VEVNDPKSVDALLSEAPDLITPEELAALMRVNPSTVTRWVRDYGLIAISLGPRLKRFRKEDVREFILHGDELSDSSDGEVSDG
jgi:excisionase family DNA binding protein